MVILRLVPRVNRPANCLKTNQTPTNIQIYLELAHLFFRFPVNRPQYRPEDMTQPPWTLIPTEFSNRPPVDIFVEEGELSDQDPDATVVDPDQTLSED